MPEIVRDGDKIFMAKDGVLFEAATAPAPTPPVPLAPSERKRSSKPEDVEWDEWVKRDDAVRDAARELTPMDHEDIRDFLGESVNRELTDEEVGQFKHDVNARLIVDLVEILDHQLHSSVEQLKRSRRTVKVVAPKVWQRKAFERVAEDPRALGTIAARLAQRGHTPEAIKKQVFGRIGDAELRSQLEEALDKEELLVEFAFDETL